jgi:hypothetical protein
MLAGRRKCMPDSKKGLRSMQLRRSVVSKFMATAKRVVL